MSRLDELTPGASIRGILPDGLVTVVNVQWFGSDALELTSKTVAGKVANELLYRHDEPRIEVVVSRPPLELRRRWRRLPARLGGERRSPQSRCAR